MRNRIAGIILIVAVLLIAIVFARAQNGSEPVHTLSPEASQVWKQIDEAQEKLRQQFAQLENQRTMLLIGANVPVEARGNCVLGTVVTCSKPKPSPAK